MKRTAHPMKIAFVGTSCIGKTWLWEAFQKECERLENVRFVHEAARAFFEHNPQVRNRFSFAAQARIQEIARSNEQIAHVYNPTVIFCDRSVLDAPAYIYALGNHEGADFLMQRVFAWVPTYTTIYLLDPRDVPYVTDDTRDESEEQRARLHEGFVALFDKYNITYQLLSGGKTERMRSVYTTIQPYIQEYQGVPFHE